VDEAHVDADANANADDDVMITQGLCFVNRNVTF